MSHRWNIINSTVQFTFNQTQQRSTISLSETISTTLLIVILSILSLLGVVFMMFGPMVRSEAWKTVDTYAFELENDENYDKSIDLDGV